MEVKAVMDLVYDGLKYLKDTQPDHPEEELGIKRITRLDAEGTNRDPKLVVGVWYPRREEKATWEISKAGVRRMA